MLNWETGPMPYGCKLDETSGYCDGGYYLIFLTPDHKTVIAFERSGIIEGWAYLNPPAPAERQSFTMETHATF